MNQNRQRTKCPGVQKTPEGGNKLSTSTSLKSLTQGKGEWDGYEGLKGTISEGLGIEKT